MANQLFARRVLIQDVDSGGNPEGDPYYGIIASDDYETIVRCDFQTLAEMNDAIEDAKSVLAAAREHHYGAFDNISDEAAAAMGVDNVDGEEVPDIDEDEERDDDDEA